MKEVLSTHRAIMMVTLLAGLVVGSPAAAADLSALAGTWLLNETESDDVWQQYIERVRDRGSGGHGARGRAASRAAQRAAEKMEEEGMPDFVRDVASPSALSFAVDGNVVTCTVNEYDRQFEVDGEESTWEMENGDQVTVKAVMEGSSLVIAHRHQNGSTVTETYELGSDGSSLTARRRIEAEKLESPLEVRLVYESEGP